jgi:hypothetical protein
MRRSGTEKDNNLEDQRAAQTAHTMNTARELLAGVETPHSMRSRPIDHRGFPVPWFVTQKTPDDRWDFVDIKQTRAMEAVKHEKCWVSGQRLGTYKAYCVGPMCVINRTAGDPPTTKEIALWSVKVCPFMSRPLARRENHSDDAVAEGAGLGGIGIMRNPGVTAVWVSKNSRFESHRRGFNLGDPEEVTWWCKGRPATREEVDASIASGIHHLQKMAAEEGWLAQQELLDYIKRAQPLLPAPQ